MYELDLINYQNKCRLIRGWDDLFTKVKEHINSVAAMKLSPYFKVHVHVYTFALSQIGILALYTLSRPHEHGEYLHMYKLMGFCRMLFCFFKLFPIGCRGLIYDTMYIILYVDVNCYYELLLKCTSVYNPSMKVKAVTCN